MLPRGPSAFLVAWLLVVALQELDAIGSGDEVEEFLHSGDRLLEGAAPAGSTANVTKPANASAGKSGLSPAKKLAKTAAKEANATATKEKAEEKKAVNSGATKEAAAQIAKDAARLKQKADQKKRDDKRQAKAAKSNEVSQTAISILQRGQQRAAQKKKEQAAANRKKMRKPTQTSMSTFRKISKESKQQRLVDRIKPGDTSSIKHDIAKVMKKTGTEKAMSKKDKRQMNAFIRSVSKTVAVEETGLPKKALKKVIGKPQAAAKFLAQKSTKQPGTTSIVGLRGKKAVLAKGETMVQYFNRELRREAPVQKLQFPNKRLADEWYSAEAARLAGAEAASGLGASMRKMQEIITKTSLRHAQRRQAAARLLLKNLQAKRAKEIHEKGDIPKASKKLAEVVDNAKNLRGKARKARKEFREAEKKTEHHNLKIVKLKEKIAQSKVKIAKATAESGTAKAQLTETMKKYEQASANSTAAEKGLKKARAKKLVADDAGKKLAAKNEVEALEKEAASALAALQKKKVAKSAATSHEKMTAAALAREEAAMKLLKSQLEAAEKMLSKAKVMQAMYKARVAAAEALARNASGMEKSYRKRYLQLVEDALQKHQVIKVLSATYYCPGLVDPITKKKLTTEELLNMFKGNQTKNLRQACNGNDECKYVVDSKVIGQATPGCSYWAYRAEFQCVTGKKKPKLQRSIDSTGRKANTTTVSGNTTSTGKGSKTELSSSVLLQIGASKAVKSLETKLAVVQAELSSDKKPKVVKGVSTEDALKEGFKKLTGVVHSKKGIHKKPVLSASLAAGGDKRALILKCAQKRSSRIKKDEQKANEIGHKLAAAKKELRRSERQVVRHTEAKIAQDKELAAKKSKTASRDQGKVVKDQEHVDIYKVRIQNLKSAIKTAPTKAAATSMKAELEKLIAAQQKASTLKEKAQAAAKKAEAGKKVAKTKAKKEEKKIGIAPAPAAPVPPEVKRENDRVKAMRSEVLKAKAKMQSLIEAIKKATAASDIAGFTSQLADAVALIKSTKAALLNAKMKRDETIMAVGEKVSTAQKRKVVKDEKAVVAAETTLATLKMKLKKSAGNPGKAAALQAQVKQAQKDLAQAKARETKAELAPTKGTAETKSQKKTLVHEKKRAEDKMARLLKFKQDQLNANMKELKEAKAVETVSGLLGQMVENAEMVHHYKKRVEAKKAQLVAAEKVKASSTQTVVAGVKNSVRQAQQIISQLQAKAEKLDKKISSSKDPEVVKVAAAQLQETKNRIQQEKARIARLEKRMQRIEKMNTVVKKPKVKTSRLDKLEKSSPKVRLAAQEVAKLKGKSADRKAEFAASITNAMSKVVGKEDAKIAAAKQKVQNSAQMKKKLVKANKGATSKSIDTTKENTLQAIKDAWIAADYGKVQHHHQKYSGKKKKRQDATKVQARLPYKVFNKESGVCRSGNCCMTTFDDPACKRKRDSLCAPHKQKTPGEWSTLIHAKASFPGKVTQTNPKPAPYSPSLDFKVRWNPIPDGQQLRLRVCGPLTPQGATVCYPSKDKSVALAKVFNAEQGKCIQTNDYVAVSLELLRSGLQKFIKDQSESKQAAKEEKKVAKKVKAASKTKTNAMKNDVKRAVGGVFKGAMGGTLGESRQPLDTQVLSLNDVDELLDLAEEHLLAKGGSFMLRSLNVTNVPKSAVVPKQ